MKTKIIFSLLIGAALLMAGCATENVTNVTPSTDTTKENEAEAASGTEATTEDQTMSEDITQEAVPDTEVDVTNYSDEDIDLYNGALQLGDDTYCEKITSQELKETCVQDVADNKIIAEAVTKMDPSICGQLEGAKVDVCKMQIDIAVKKSDDLREPTAEEWEIMNRAQAAKDPSLCDAIESERKRENCRINVETIKAQESSQ